MTEIVDLSKDEAVFLDKTLELFITNIPGEEVYHKEEARLLSLLNLDPSWKARYALYNQKFWEYVVQGTHYQNLSKEQIRKYDVLRRTSRDLLDCILKYKLDKDFSYVLEEKSISFFNVYEGREGFLDSDDVDDLLVALKDFDESLLLIIRNKKKYLVFNEFVCEVAKSFESVTKTTFTTSHSTEELVTNGELFVQSACAVVERIHHNVSLSAKAYSELRVTGDIALYGIDENIVTPDNIIKRACEAAKKKLESSRRN